MSQDSSAIAAEIARHLLSVQALAALGAELRLRQEGLDAHPLLRERLRAAVRAVHPDLPDGLAPDAAATTLASIRFALREATDLLAEPARAPGWRHEDPELIQSIGRASRRVVHEIEAAAAARPALREALRRPGGSFLDVGTGAGWLALAAARAWPALRVVGLDIWEPSLALARANLAAAGPEVAGRIELRQADVAALADRDAFALAWLPLMFLPAALVPAALARLRDALAPGGWLVAGRFAAPPGHPPLGEALVALRTVRSGGHPWTDGELEALLRDAGFGPAEHLPTAQVHLTLARR